MSACKARTEHAEDAGRSTETIREDPNKFILDSSRLAESGTYPDSAPLDQALACSIRERAIHGARQR